MTTSSHPPSDPRADAWPALPLEAWQDTADTLHLWTQIVGKVRLAQTPWINHSWHVTLYVTPRGLSTSPVPHGTREFAIDFDFVDHRLLLQSSDGRTGGFPLKAMTVAAFYRLLMEELERLGLRVAIVRRPCEIAAPIPCDRDETHGSYDSECVNRYWRILVQAERVLRVFRAPFIGKVSPIHYFWGAPDLAVTRFSGRTAPEHPGGIPGLPDRVTRDAYSHEVSSAGFWYGGGPVPRPVFYSYAYPEPPGFAQAKVAPAEAFYSTDLREFLLPYDAVRGASSPDETLLAFLRSTYEAAADLGRWDRPALERRSDPGKGERSSGKTGR